MGKKKDEEYLVQLVTKYTIAEDYASSVRGNIIHLATNIENTLTDIIACAFYPSDSTSANKSQSLLEKNRIELKSLLLNKCMFQSKPATIPDEIGHPTGANRPPLPGRLM
jgi:hypothetical protein